MTEITLSLQLFSVRGLGNLNSQLEAAALSGFRSVEALEAHLATPEAFKDALTRHHLDCPSAHVSLDLLRRRLSNLADACHTLGIRSLFVPDAPSDRRADRNGGWERFGAELASLADELGGYGLALGYHNKDQGFSALSGGFLGFETLFRAARGSALKWQADVAWLHRVGLEPSVWLKRYADILISAHVKDQAPTGTNDIEDGWTEVGAGTMLWPSLWKVAVDCGAKTLVVEHDNPKEPIRFARQSFAYLSRFVPA